MTIIEKDGKKYIQIEKEIHSLSMYNNTTKGDYVEYNGVIYIFRGWGIDTVYLEKLDGEEIELKWY